MPAQHQALVGELAGQAGAVPADERLAGQLMLALYRCGQQAEALRWFERTRLHLGDELGAHPGPQLRALHQQILRAASYGKLPGTGPVQRSRQAGTAIGDRRPVSSKPVLIDRRALLSKILGIPPE